ncbi:MAG TPA: hypothetical protein VGF30_03760, partial [Bacteroidia bacterium]
MKNVIWILILTGLSIFSTQALTCTAIASGTWQSASTWSCGSAPPCGATIVIPSGFTVTVNNVQNYTGCGSPLLIQVSGELVFNGGKLRMTSGSEIYVYSGATVRETGPGNGNSSTIEIGGTTLWNADSPPVTGPASIPTGLNLPIQLVYFTAEGLKNHTVQLKWQTASETNNNYFELQRSTDDLNFTDIARIDGAGNSNTLINYKYIDENPIQGNNYYRLKQVDFDGNFHYSPIELAYFEKP